MNKNSFTFFGVISLFILFSFGAYRTFYFSDDFKFLAASRQFDLFAFFSPIRTTFYRPLPTEFFYFFLQRFPLPMFTGHIFVFFVFLLGVYFLYKTISLITKSKEIAFFSSILYLFHFSHVYQLYWFATFQEVAQFTLLVCSLYFILNKKFSISLGLFILALFSKEQALLFPFITLFFYYVKHKKIYPLFIIYIILDCIFIALHIYVNSRMPILPEYVIHLSPKLFINNALWYGLWSMGFPAMMSDYMRSIFSLPFGDFWNYFSSLSFKIYFFGMLGYLILFISSVVYLFFQVKKERKFTLTYIGINIILFLFFLLPVLPIAHKWMVRLTIPLIFVSLIEGLILSMLWNKKISKGVAVVLLGLYLVWNYFGIKQHEIISTYTLESSITINAEKIFANKQRFDTCKIIYIKDPAQMKMGSWDGSEKIALTLSGDSFLSYYFPKRNNMQVFYEYKTRTVPKGSCIVDAAEFIKWPQNPSSLDYFERI